MVLPGQGHQALQGLVISSMQQLWSNDQQEKTRINMEKIPLHCHFIHHKADVN